VTILVTGVAGFIGFYVSTALLKAMSLSLLKFAGQASLVD
jgi:nucleoside-diphosphate-sugar epimerase